MADDRWTQEQLDQYLAKFAKPTVLDRVIAIADKHTPKPSKYRNVKTTVDGIVFDSAKEARHWEQLKLLQAAGEIFDLAYQVSYALIVNGQLVCRYVADFYHVTKYGERVVTDVKSAATRKLPTYRIKRKLMKAIHGIDIREV